MELRVRKTYRRKMNVDIFGMLEWAEQDPISALWFANRLGAKGIKAWYYDKDRDKCFEDGVEKEPLVFNRLNSNFCYETMVREVVKFLGVKK